MNIHITKSVNKKLKNDEVSINIEFSENYNEIENIIKYIKEFDKRKMVVYLNILKSLIKGKWLYMMDII